MELPKNVTQIGEADRHCKVYVEDYVISYFKQLKQTARDQNTAIALYGRKEEENGVAYMFLYGAARIDSLQRQTRHLSQAQVQEIEKLRMKYFSPYVFLGYQILDGEMVEGFYICEQNVCRYIAGYACFYEKNDAMLSYMVESRKEQVQPETTEQEKYDRLRQKQETRRQEQAAGHTVQGTNKRIIRFPENRKEKSIQRGGQRPDRMAMGMNGSGAWTKVAVAGAFLVLCVMGTATFSDDAAGDMQAATQKIIAEFTERKLTEESVEEKDSLQSEPNEEEEIVQQETVQQTNTLVTEERLTEALLQENTDAQEAEKTQIAEGETQEAQPEESQSQAAVDQVQNIQSEAAPEQVAQSEGDQLQDAQPEGDLEQGTQPEGDQLQTLSGQAQETIQEEAVSQSPESYRIQKGDTLIAISIARYGTDAMVKEICEKNGIDDPDNIYFGQKILLP